MEKKRDKDEGGKLDDIGQHGSSTAPAQLQRSSFHVMKT